MKSILLRIWLILCLAAPVAFGQQGQPTPAEEVPAVELLPAPAPTLQDAVSILEAEKPTTGERNTPPPPAPLAASDAANSFINGVPPQSMPIAGQPYEVLLRGPVHEAFAIREAVKVSAATIAARPPTNVFELIPGTKPKGNDVQWVPGYWSYFDDAGDFVWIAGFYRDVPPGRKWVEGYWLESTQGFTWISGYWGAQGESGSVLPEPPANRNDMPGSTSPSGETFWMPGEWSYVDSQYTWKPGFWTKFHDEWTWQPTYFIDTTEGYIQVSGYWDYQPKYRGVPYAPVIFAQIPNNYEFAPIYSIGKPLDVLLHLFAKENGRGYFYGNYYAQAALLAGYSPWYQLSPNTFPTSNLLSYFSWKYDASGISFSDSVNRYATFYKVNASERPGQDATANQLLATKMVLSTNPFGKNWDSIVRAVPNTRASTTESSLADRRLLEQTRRSQNNISSYPSQLQSQQARQSGQVLDAYGRPLASGTNSLSNSNRQLQPQPLAQSRLPTVSERTQASRYGGTPNVAQQPSAQQPTTLRDRIRSRIIAGPTMVAPTIGGRIVAPPALVPPIMPPTLVPGFVPTRIAPPVPAFAPRFGRRR